MNATTMQQLPLLPTATTGAYTVPGWLLAAQQQIANGELGRAEIAEVFDDAVTIALDDQIRAGIDVLTDGEMRRVNFIMGFYQRIQGLEQVEPFRKLGLPLYDKEALYETRGKLSAPETLGIVDELLALRKKTDRPIKMTVPGPLTLLTPVVRRDAYSSEESLIADLQAIVRAELEGLQAAGCEFVQIDEPAFHRAFENDLSGAAKLFNELVEGLTMKVALHVCFGNNSGRPRTRRSYKRLIPFLSDVHASQLVLEYANREMSEVELWPEFGGDKELAAGVVDQKSFYRETAEDVAERIRTLLEHVPAKQLWLNPDCGLMVTPRWIGRAKLQALCDGAKTVRHQLSS
ncbi:MAG: cobalamin-independent methionine synthase II family protein [Chloroflexota bacterium]|nr:cobalamin-independent methionine synthase II family protein [Chloroflexota bacterium]